MVKIYIYFLIYTLHLFASVLLPRNNGDNNIYGGKYIQVVAIAYIIYYT